MPRNFFSELFNGWTSEDEETQYENYTRQIEEQRQRFQEMQRQIDYANQNAQQDIGRQRVSAQQLGELQSRTGFGGGGSGDGQGVQLGHEHGYYYWQTDTISTEVLSNRYNQVVYNDGTQYIYGLVYPEKPKRTEPIKFAKEEDYYTWLAGNRD